MSSVREQQPSSDNSITVNVADRLAQVARQLPDAIAVATPGRGDVAGQNSYRTCTFAELDRDATALARGLVEMGVEPGTRLALMVKPSVDLVKLVFAVLRSGATMVLVDPGMGRRHLLNCLAAVEPEGFIAISVAQAVRTVLRHRFPLAKHNVTVGRRWFWGGMTYEQVLRQGQVSQAELAKLRASDVAAIVYTSGSTGPPKGVLYTHQIFDTQVAEISGQYNIRPGGFDLACFPLFGLFNSAMGVTTVFPDMDFSRPATADPRKLLAAANDWQVTQAFASPAVWNKLSRHCETTGDKIPTLRKVFSCGAPVPATVLRRTLACVAEGAEMHTPYGATESLPIATIEAAEVLGETAQQTDEGAGVCVGRKFNTIDWRVIRITDEPIASIDDVEDLTTGEIGELIVRGPQVSAEYLESGKRKVESGVSEHNALAKISDGDTIWHRMGDVGYFDEQGRFWYCGRKSQRVQTAHGTLYTIPVEAQVNAIRNVRRSALVGIGVPPSQRPQIIVEIGYDLEEALELLEDGVLGRAELEELTTTRIQEMLASSEVLRELAPALFHLELPTDIRHNSKINREQLAAWATEQLSTKHN